MRGILEENSHPPFSPASLRMYVLRLPPRDKTIEQRSIDCLIFFFLIELKTFLSNRSIWVPKYAEFYTDSKSEGKKNAWKKVIIKKLFFC